MRHQKNTVKLGRKSAHRKAMLSNMASSLILHKRISTTLQKAKALRSYVEPLITKAKEDSTHSRRLVFSYLQNKEAVSELFREISQKVSTRPGGYTRILKIGPRLGDNAEMAIIELVDYNELMLEQKQDQKTKVTKRRRGGAKKKADGETPAAQTPKPVQKVIESAPVTESIDEPIADTADKPVADAAADLSAKLEPSNEQDPEPKN